jgi:hypothetical protein
MQAVQNFTPQARPGQQFKTTQKFGSRLEQWAARQLTQLGHTARLVSDFFAPFDILIDDCLPCEVKAARPYRHHNGKGVWRLRWQFDLQRGLDPRQADFIYILIAVDGSDRYPFIIPSAWAYHRSTAILTSHPRHYRGWLAGGLDAWQHVNMVKAWRMKFQAHISGQLALFEGVTL